MIEKLNVRVKKTSIIIKKMVTNFLTYCGFILITYQITAEITQGIFNFGVVKRIQNAKISLSRAGVCG
jgi:hypothetical protein